MIVSLDEAKILPTKFLSVFVSAADIDFNNVSSRESNTPLQSASVFFPFAVRLMRSIRL
jgi:hypothetical protein